MSPCQAVGRAAAVSATVGAWAFSNPLSRIRAPELALALCSKKLYAECCWVSNIRLIHVVTITELGYLLSLHLTSLNLNLNALGVMCVDD